MEHEILTRALRPGPDCLPLEQLGRYADGILSAADRREAAAHIDGCVTCQAELALLGAFSTTPVRDDEKEIIAAAVTDLQRRGSPVRDEQQDEPSTWQRWIPFGLSLTMLVVTTALLTVVGSYYLLKSTAPRLPTDTGSDVEATRSLKVPVQGPTGDQLLAPDRLEWRAVGGTIR